DARAACPDGMTQGYRPPVDIELVLRDGEFPPHRYRLGGEGLVELEEVDVSQLDARLLQSQFNGPNRSHSHDAGSHPGARVAPDSCERHAMLGLGAVVAHDHDRCGAVVD